MGIEDIKVGEKKEIKHQTPKPVEIEEYKTETKDENECVVLKVKHPDGEEQIEIRSIKLEKYGKVKVEGIWLGLDDKGLIPYDSNLAVLLRLAKADTVGDLVGKTIPTDIQNVNHPRLVVKAY